MHIFSRRSSKIIRQCSPADINQKTIAVIIPDDTRLWARGDLFVPVIIDTLAALEVPFDRMRIIIALGTHPESHHPSVPGD